MDVYHFCHRVRRPRRSGSDHGMALITAMMFLVVLIVLGATTVTVTMLSSQISGNYKASVQAFQAAEAGAEETRARLRANAANPIVDTAPTQTQWQAYIGSAAQAQVYGYNGSAPQVRTDSLQTALQYTVVVTHAADNQGHVLYWGDPTSQGVNTRNTTAGQNIYIITSHGAAGGAHSTVQTQVTRVPPPPVPSALYVKAPLTLQGSSTYISGQDHCGGTDLPGLSTPLPESQNGNPTITQNGQPTVLGTPDMLYNGKSLNILTLVNALKDSADFTYTVTSATRSGLSWGTPTPGADQQSASSCTESHMVYYNTGGTYLRMTGSVTGCGILLVDGDLQLTGGFSWYGVVIATGAIMCTGGGNKNISGALLSGGGVIGDVIGGNATIVNCRQAITNATRDRPLLVLNWTQL